MLSLFEELGCNAMVASLLDALGCNAVAPSLLEVLDRNVVNAVRPVRPQRVDALVNHVEHVPLRLLVRLEVETKLVLHLRVHGRALDHITGK